MVHNEGKVNLRFLLPIHRLFIKFSNHQRKDGPYCVEQSQKEAGTGLPGLQTAIENDPLLTPGALALHGMQ